MLLLVYFFWVLLVSSLNHEAMGNSRWFLPPGRCLAIQILPSLQRSLWIPSPLLTLITYYFLSSHQPPSHQDSQYHRILWIITHPSLLRVSQFCFPHQPVNFLRVEAMSGASEPAFSGVSTLSLHLSSICKEIQQQRKMWRIHSFNNSLVRGGDDSFSPICAVLQRQRISSPKIQTILIAFLNQESRPHLAHIHS